MQQPKGIFTEEDLPLSIESRRGEHSEKPDEAYQALERLYGDVRRLDLFARREAAQVDDLGQPGQPNDARVAFAEAMRLRCFLPSDG